MKNQTRILFNKLKHDAATSNGVPDVTEKFNLSPSVEQRLTERVQESADFLSKVNIVGVTEQKGQKLGLGIGSPIASRTDTNNKERETAYVGSLTPDEYDCKQTNFDTHIGYRTLDMWAGLPNFKQLYRKAVIKRMALDRIMVGWNGTSAAIETVRANNPLLQDVNIGWLEKVRRNSPKNFMGYDSQGNVSSDDFTFGFGGKYNTLDALVFNAMSDLLDPWYQGSDDLVLIIGRELWVNHGLTLYNDNRAATERNALQTWFAIVAFAGL